MLYPDVPMPASISAPAWIDPIISYRSDGGYEVRRALASRPRQRYELVYLGVPVQEMRYLRDFLLAHRLGVNTFEFRHLTAFNAVPVGNTTPVILTYYHGLITGNWINIGAGPAALLGNWQVTRLASNSIALNGTVAVGLGTAVVSTYLPYAVARFNENTWESPVKLMGPDQLNIDGRREGHFSFQVTVEEVF